mgnify:CR=1 FL=1
MSFWDYVDLWDFVALFLVFFCFWLGIWGVNAMQSAAGEKVDAKALRIRALGGAVAGALYLLVHVWMIVQD